MKKKFAIVSGSIALALLLIGVWGYTTYFKPDPVLEEQLYEQFGEDFFSFEEESLEDLIVADNNKATSENENSNALPTNNQPSKPQPDTQPSNTQPSDRARAVNGDKTIQGNEGAKEEIKDSNSNTKTVTKEEINDKYKFHFERLQNAGLGRLDVLFSAAAQEYKENKKAGTLNRSELLKKYIQAGTKLESNVDKSILQCLKSVGS